MEKLTLAFVLFTLILFSNPCFAASSMEFKAFAAFDMDSLTAAKQCNKIAVQTYKSLGYINSLGASNYLTTAYKSPVINYLHDLGNNFAFYVMSHGNVALFTMELNNTSQYVYPSDVQGYWHLVFINSCLSFSNDRMARAFNP